jgi:hypothetical protein
MIAAAASAARSCILQKRQALFLLAVEVSKVQFPAPTFLPPQRHPAQTLPAM